jgi:hypothetical protein
MVISTRQSTDQDVSSKAVDGINELLEEFTSGIIGSKANSVIASGDDLDTALQNLRAVLEVQQGIAQAFMNDAMSLSHENLVLTIKLAEAMGLLDSLTNVSYDDALDHATADLMDALVSSGVADVDHSGDLVFDARVALKKGDLKPVLREAITRWVDLKIQ